MTHHGGDEHEQCLLGLIGNEQETSPGADKVLSIGVNQAVKKYLQMTMLGSEIEGTACKGK